MNLAPEQQIFLFQNPREKQEAGKLMEQKGLL